MALQWIGHIRAISWAWSASIVLVWIFVAIDLDQPIWALQHSRDLVRYGAIKGSDLSLAESWRLLGSQWLHVKFPHMLFNALVIGIVGKAVERRSGWSVAVAVGLLGGALAQLVTCLANPTAFISGASQAYLALCGLALATLRPRSMAWSVAAIATLVAAGIDLFVSSHGALKIGHITSFAVGSLAGFAVVKSRSSPRFASDYD